MRKRGRGGFSHLLARVTEATAAGLACFGLVLGSLVFSLFAANDAQACVSFKGTPSGTKDEFFLVGELIFIGSADYWNSSYDPYRDPDLNLLDSYLPEAAIAQERLNALGIELGAAVYLQARVSSTNMASGIMTHDVQWLKVQFAGLEFSDFGANTTVETAVSYTLPTPHTTVDGACDGNDPCDWLWIQATLPATVTPSGTNITMDSSFVDSEQRGANLYAGAVVGTMPLRVGPVVETDPSLTVGGGESVYMIDLTVPDLPEGWTSRYGSNVRLGAYLSGGYYYYGTAVPAVSSEGAAVLIFAVLAIGFLALVCPRPRRSS